MRHYGLLFEAGVFTLLSRKGQEIILGQPEQRSWAGSYLLNLGMLSVLRVTTAGYQGTFHRLATTNPIAFQLGQFATAMLSLQGFMEVQHRVEQGHWMTPEERVTAFVTNVIMGMGLEAGRFLSKPLANRLFPNTLQKIKENAELKQMLDEINGLQTNLIDFINGLTPGQVSKVQLAELLKRVETLWNKEVDLIRAAEQRKAITPGEAERELGAYRKEIAYLQMTFARLSVEAPFAMPVVLFRPLRPGLVEFVPGSEVYLKEFFKDNPLTETTIPGPTGEPVKALEATSADGSTTTFVARGVFPRAEPTHPFWRGVVKNVVLFLKEEAGTVVLDPTL